MVEGLRKQCRPKSQRFDNISDCTKMDANQLLHRVNDRDGWRKYVVNGYNHTIMPFVHSINR